MTRATDHTEPGSGLEQQTASSLSEYFLALIDRFLARVIAGILLIAVEIIAGSQLVVSESWILFSGLLIVVTVWLVALQRQWDRLGSPLFIVASLCGLAGTTLGHMTPLIGLVSTVMLLAAWDLQHLAWRMLNLTSTMDADAYLIRHLVRLGLVLALGLILALLPLQFSFELPFVPTLAIGIACCAILFWALGAARKLSNGSPQDS